MNNRDTLKRLGVPVDKVTTEEAVERFAEFMNTDGMSVIATPNSEILVGASDDPVLFGYLCGADLAIPDGAGIVYASRILGQPLKERVTGIDFTHAALIRLAEMGKSVYFLGAKPGIAEKAAANLVKEIPGLKIAGTRDGYYKPEEEDAIVDEINASGAEFLCAALGSPKQELFANKYRNRLKVKAFIGIGGSLDVWSGTLQRAPEFYQKHGLEWVFRFKQEPSRIWSRGKRLPLFLLKVITENNKYNKE